MKKEINRLWPILFLLILWGCGPDKSDRSESDSALTAPVDTLGKDTLQKSGVADSVPE